MLRCPVCKKKLWLNPTMRVGTLVGCVNCDTSLRVTNRNPDRLEPIKQSETLTADSKPESYA